MILCHCYTLLKFYGGFAMITLLNRELGVLEFNARVLFQAADPSTPLLERLRFLCIVSSNLDEFFEVRIAALKQQFKDQPNQITPDHLSLTQAIHIASQRAQELVKEQYTLLHQLLPLLEKEGIFFHMMSTWNPAQRDWAYQYFIEEVQPILTPIALDPTHPFPRVLNKSLNFALELDGCDAFGREMDLAIVQAPRALPRMVKMPKALSGYEHGFLLLSSVMQAFVHELFPGLLVKGCYQFRVTRNSDLFVADDEITDLRVALQGELPSRHLGDAVRLEISTDMPQNLSKRLLNECDLDEGDCYRVNGPVNLVRLMTIPNTVDRPDLKFGVHHPAPVKAFADGADIFSVLRKHDVLLHHPYESFNPVIDLVRQAARDPNVLAIKQTVYRTGTDSPLMEALLDAARAGKEVTVVVELLARFDEETNIHWAAKLEAVGAHIVYGVVGHKCHAKMLMIIRREPKDTLEKGEIRHIMRRYIHLGTGNYHPRTARLYTDFGLMSSNPKLGEDVHHVFMTLTGAGARTVLNYMWQSPFNLHEQLIRHIRQETEIALQGKPARIMAKMNALLEEDVINTLYTASQAGVKIDLIVRGVCALKPNVVGLSENIHVRSIIGQFLEHHRIYYFLAEGEQKIFLSSADWMDRNLLSRVEVAFPILDKKLKQRVIREGLLVHLRDNAAAWIMNGAGQYTRCTPIRRRSFISQLQLIRMFSRRTLEKPMNVLG
jgi:polyphosphate kinase